MTDPAEIQKAHDQVSRYLKTLFYADKEIHRLRTALVRACLVAGITIEEAMGEARYCGISGVKLDDPDPDQIAELHKQVNKMAQENAALRNEMRARGLEPRA